ncbi:MAG: hypothetical protein AB2L24_26720 [Mangrovibacterium sp.]
MMDPEQYITYTTDDFILDEDFREIVRESDFTKRLKELFEALPEKKQEINLAIQILRGLYSGKHQQTDPRKQELWQQILRKQKKKVRLLYFRIAASLLLLISIGSGVYYFSVYQPNDRTDVINENPS